MTETIVVIENNFKEKLLKKGIYFKRFLHECYRGVTFLVLQLNLKQEERHSEILFSTTVISSSVSGKKKELIPCNPSNCKSISLQENRRILENKGKKERVGQF